MSMKTNETIQTARLNSQATPRASGKIILNKERFVQILEEIKDLNDLNLLKNKIIALKDILIYPKNDRAGILNIDANGDTVSLPRDILISELEQISDAQTMERAKYYIKRLQNGIQKIRTGKVNDINVLRWKEYEEIITDSLWVLERNQKKLRSVICLLS